VTFRVRPAGSSAFTGARYRAALRVVWAEFRTCVHAGPYGPSDTQETRSAVTLRNMRTYGPLWAVRYARTVRSFAGFGLIGTDPPIARSRAETSMPPKNLEADTLT
jgi:hypothetical protein